MTCGKLAMTGAERARNFRARRAQENARKAKAARASDRPALLLAEFPNEMNAHSAYVKSGCLRMPSFAPTKLRRPTLAQLTAEPRAIGQREADRLKQARAARPASSVGIAQPEPILLPRVAKPPAKRRNLSPAAARAMEHALALADRIERTSAGQFQHRSNYDFESAALPYRRGVGYRPGTRAPSPREYTPRPPPIAGISRDLITREHEVPREISHHAPTDEFPDLTGEEYSTCIGTARQMFDRPDVAGESSDAYADPTDNPTPEPDPVVRSFVDLRAATESDGTMEAPDDTSGDIDDEIELPPPSFLAAERAPRKGRGHTDAVTR